MCYKPGVTPVLTLGDALRQARKEKQLSQLKLADRLGCERQRIILWEKNRHRPGLRYQRMLTETLDLDPKIFDEPKSEEEERLELFEEWLDERAKAVAAG